MPIAKPYRSRVHLRIAGSPLHSHYDSSSPSLDDDSSIAHLLTTQRDKYTSSQGDPWISFYHFPTTALMNIARIRTQVSAAKYSRRIGINPTVACCLDIGAAYLADRHEIRSLALARTTFENSASPKNSRVKRVLSYLLEWGDEISVSSDATKRINASLPLEVHSTLTSVADNINASQALSSIGLICVLHALSLQPECNDEDRDEFRKHVDTFLEMVDIRARLLNAGLREFNL